VTSVDNSYILFYHPPYKSVKYFTPSNIEAILSISNRINYFIYVLHIAQIPAYITSAGIRINLVIFIISIFIKHLNF